MQSRISVGCLALLLIALAGAAQAQVAYDMADHLMLKPGQWMMEESRQLNHPQAPIQKIGIIVTQQGPFVVKNEFDWNGKAWVPTDVNIFKVTATHVEYHGWYEPSTGQYGLLAQPMRIPRYMKLNQPFTYQGKMVSGTRSESVGFHIVITADNITKTVKSGTYTKCIRVKITVVTDRDSEVSSEVLAAGHGRVGSVEVELDETEPVTSMLSGEIYERTDPKKP